MYQFDELSLENKYKSLLSDTNTVDEGDLDEDEILEETVDLLDDGLDDDYVTGVMLLAELEKTYFGLLDGDIEPKVAHQLLSRYGVDGLGLESNATQDIVLEAVKKTKEGLLQKIKHTINAKFRSKNSGRIKVLSEYSTKLKALSPSEDITGKITENLTVNGKVVDNKTYISVLEDTLGGWSDGAVELYNKMPKIIQDTLDAAESAHEKADKDGDVEAAKVVVNGISKLNAELLKASPLNEFKTTLGWNGDTWNVPKSFVGLSTAGYREVASSRLDITTNLYVITNGITSTSVKLEKDNVINLTPAEAKDRIAAICKLLDNEVARLREYDKYSKSIMKSVESISEVDTSVSERLVTLVGLLFIPIPILGPIVSGLATNYKFDLKVLRYISDFSSITIAQYRNVTTTQASKLMTVAANNYNLLK